MLAAIGIYGVMAYVVSQRTRRDRRPDGTRRDVDGSIPAGVGDGLRLTAIGVVHRHRRLTGGRAGLKTLLFGVGSGDSADPRRDGDAAARRRAIACLVPARRAMRVDPMEALRAE